MIDKNKVKEVVEKAIEGTDIFIVDIKVSPRNEVVVEIDSPDALDIDTCARINREIEAAIPSDDEDYELEVGSAGLTSPFKVLGQYLKNVGNPVEVLTKDGRKLSGTLEAAGEENFTLGYDAKVKIEGKKRPELQHRTEVFPYDAVKKVNYLISFK